MPPLTSLTLPYITATLAARLEVVISRPRPVSHPFTLRTEHTHPRKPPASSQPASLPPSPVQQSHHPLPMTHADEAQTGLEGLMRVK